MRYAIRVLPWFLALAALPQAGAITLQFANGVNTTSTSSIANCGNPLYNANYTGCTTSAFISSSLAGPYDYFSNLSGFGGGSSLGEESFASALALSYPNYTINYDPTGLSGITLTVTNFSTSSTATVGGISNITVTATGTLGANDPTASQLMWIQGLEINYQPGLAGNPSPSFDTSTNYNVMDTSEFDNLGTCQTTTQGGTPTTPDTVPANTGVNAGNPYCGPIYPYQYSNDQFFDAPQAPWPNGSFRAIALLGTINTQNDSVTVYGGVSYGFDNSVAPEPRTWVLLLAGGGLLLFLKRRNARTV